MNENDDDDEDVCGDRPALLGKAEEVCVLVIILQFQLT
jgi:hypothetical protein